MITRLILSAILLLALAPISARAQQGPAATLYDQATLDHWGGRYERSTWRILKEGLVPELTAEEYNALGALELSFPARGDNLIGFYAAWPPPRIVMPALSLKLLDDLSIANAWLWAKGYSAETVEEYVAMLRYKRPGDFPGGRYPEPFVALQIPANAIEDPKIDDLSLRLFNSARAFILAHEMAHILFRHQGKGPDVLRNEIEADVFALDLLARTGTIPMGMILYFQAMAHWAPNRAQFASEADWQTFLTEHKTHPLSGERIAAIADALDRLAPSYARHDPNAAAAEEVVLFIAESLSQLVDYLDDPDMQRCVGESAFEASLEDLAPRAGGSSRLACAD